MAADPEVVQSVGKFSWAIAGTFSRVAVVILIILGFVAAFLAFIKNLRPKKKSKK